MSTKLSIAGIFLLAVAGLVYGAYVSPHIPAVVPTHWDLQGHVNGWSPKAVSLYLMPCLVALIALFVVALPWLSPKGFAIEPFRATFNYGLFIAAVMLTYGEFIILRAALDPGLNPTRALMSGIYLSLALLGNVLGKIRRNFWIGVRTPWTLASDTVWQATHRFAARLFVALGLLGAILCWFPIAALWAIVVLPVMVFVPVVFSAVISKRLNTS